MKFRAALLLSFSSSYFLLPNNFRRIFDGDSRKYGFLELRRSDGFSLTVDGNNELESTTEIM
jgi:hypothetical protein